MMTAISHDTPESKVLQSRLLELCSTKLNHIIHVTIYENPRERERGVVEGANAEEASVSYEQEWPKTQHVAICSFIAESGIPDLDTKPNYWGQIHRIINYPTQLQQLCQEHQAAVIMTDGILVNFRIWLQKQTHISVI